MSEYKLRVLSLLEEGRITVDEAARLLAADSGGQKETQAHVSSLRDGGVLGEIGGSLRGVGDAVNEVMTDVGNELRNNKELQSAFSGLISALRNAGAGRSFEFEHTGVLSATLCSVVMRGTNGKLMVQGWDRPDYKLICRVTVRGASEEEAREAAESAYRFESDDAGICLDPVSGPRNISLGATLYLPRHLRYSVKLSTGNGSIRLQDLEGEQLKADTSNGAVSLENGCFSTAWVETSNGTVTIARVAGGAHVRTSNGSIKIDASQPATPHAEFDLATSNGSITVRIPPDGDTGVSIEASTSNGRVKANVASLAMEPAGRRRLRVRSEGYEEAPRRLDILARTSNGSINIAQAE